MIMFKRLDRYILRHFFLSLFVVVMALGFTIIVINMVEELRDFIDHRVPFMQIVEYYVFFAGWVIKSFFPLFVMLATLFSVSILARRNELLAMKASGRSLYRIALPLLITGLLLSAGHFYYNEYVFPPANQRRLEIKKFTIEKRSREVYAKVSRVIRQISPGNFYTMNSFNTIRNDGVDFKMYTTRGNQLTSITTAKKIIYDDFQWKAIEGIQRVFDTPGSKQYAEFDTLVIPEIEDKPSDLAKRIGKPEDMSLDELKYYIDLMKRTGGPYIQEQINLKLKYSYPLTSAIVMLICIPFAANPRRGGVAVSFATGAVIALVYFVLFRIMQSAGYNEKIPQELAVWGVNGLFLIIGLFFMLRARK